MMPEEFEQKRQAAIDRITKARRPKGRTARPAFDTTKMARDGIQEANPGGILSQPIPVTPKGEEYMKALDKVAPNVYAPTPERLEQQRSGGGAATMAPTQKAPPQMAPAARQGPMSGIYSERPVGDMQQKYLQGLGLRQQYNEAQPRSQKRAGVLNEIWDRGGVPVIGGGTQRAPVQDFGGVNGVMDSMAKMRGVDTGMKVGSPEAEAHGLALAKHRGGDVYGGGDRAAHLRRNRETAIQGLLDTWGDERAMQKEAAQVAIDQARKGGGLNLTPDQALKQYEVDQRTAVDREKIAAEDRRAQEIRDAEANAKAAAEAARGIREVNGVFIGPDDKPLAEPEQKMWSARKTALTSVAEPQTMAAIKEMQKNPDAYAVRIDRTTGKVAVGPSKRKGMFGEKDAEWLGETLPDKTPRYATPYEYDPVIAGVLYSQYGI